MKLIGSPTSPFVRKVRVLLYEKGFPDVDIEMYLPLEDPAELIEINPLCRVPAMVLSNGVIFYESKLIVEYIESTMQGPKFVPESGAARWFALQAQAHADNLIDIGIRAFLERQRPADKQIKHNIMRDEMTVVRGIAAAAKIVNALDDQVNIGHIAIACALGFIDFRLPHIKWREQTPELSAWYQEMRLRPSMQATVPKLPDQT